MEERNALHVLPKSVNEFDIKCNIENTVDHAVNLSNIQTDSDFRDEVKIATKSFLNKSKQICSSRINQFLHKKLSRLRKDKKIKICSLGKGNGVCIMNSNDYLKKLDTIVHDKNKYTKLDFDINSTDHDICKKAPWIKKEDSIKYYVRTYIRPCVDKFTYKRLMPCGSGPGRMYGMAKQHKQNCPLRPVNSMIGTPEYFLAKWLDAYIKAYLPNEFSINSTKSFIGKLKEQCFSSNDFCVSFDVESLFTNVPLNEVICDIADTMFEHSNPFPVPDSSEAKRLTKSVFKKLLHLCTEGIFCITMLFISKRMAALWVPPWDLH